MVKRRPERDKSKYIVYEELKQYVREKKILTKQDYIKHVSKCFMFNEKNIPYNPSTFYSKDVWEGWSIFLRNDVVKKNYNGTYYTYDECKSAISKYNFISKSDFLKRISDVIKEDIRIPYSPNTIYRERWEGWIGFLNTDNIFYNDVDYVDFEEARRFARSLNLKLYKEWRNLDSRLLFEKNIPKKVERRYKDKGWIDWNDFLGIDKRTKMSYGEVLVANFLDKNNIKYIYNKSLKDCISSSKLRFDFYLLDFNVCIEFDGIQHFQPVVPFGGEKEFEKLKIRDGIKNKWCEVNNVELIRFNYLQQKEDIYEQLEKFVYK